MEERKKTLRWQRQKVDITNAELILNVGSALFIGALACGLIVGVRYWVGDKSFGSLADWAAAGGTWVVGFMAWRISVRSQEHNEFTQKDNALRTAKHDLALLRSIHYQVRGVVAGAMVVLGEEVEKLSRRLALQLAQTYGAISIDNDRIFEVMPLLSSKEIDLLEDIQTNNFVCGVNRNRLISVLSDGDGEGLVTEGDLAFFRAFSTQLDKLRVDCEELTKSLVENHGILNQ